MEILVRELDAVNLKHLQQWDDTFVAESKLVLQFENGALEYTIESMPSRRKQYPRNENYSAYINNADQILFIAFTGDQPVGQIALRKNWNRFAFIDELGVDPRFRKQGIGRALMNCGIAWAQQKNFAGVVAETQDVNVSACLFYEHYGFRLSGFDRMLYRGIDPTNNEIALFWYWVFPP